MPKKRALLIGINKYPYLADFSELKGCHNDVSILKQVLEEKFGFEPSDFRVMKSEEATRAKILAAMVSLVEDSEQDDTIVFYFSGHGSRMKADDRVKTSGWYETIMPYDSGRLLFHPEAVNRDITDDEIYDWLTMLGEKTSNIVLIFDSCFASSIIRSETSGRKSGVAPGSKTPMEPRFVFNKTGKANKGRKKKGRSGWLPLSEKYVLLSAAREYQPANICKLDDGEQYSIFTYHLCEALREAREGDTYHDVWEQASVMVKSRFEDQDPELEGKRNRKLFGLDEFVPFSFLPVGKRLDETVFLSGGELHGVMEGSRWAIYPAGTKLIEPGKNNALGRIKVVSTDGLTSEAVLLDEIEPGAVREGQRAVEISFPKEKSLRVWVENGVPEFARQIENLKENVDHSPILESAGEEQQADVKIRLQEVIQKEPSKSGRTAAAPAWVVYDPDDCLLMSPRPSDSLAEIPGIVEDLERIARYRRTLGLRNPNSILRDKVDFSILRQNDDLTWTEVVPSEDDPKAMIYESDRLALRILNRFEAPIYISILDLGLSKRVSLLYPPPGARIMIGPSGKQVSEAGETTEGAGILTVGQRAEEGYFEISFPKDFPFILSGTSDTGVVKEGVEIYKLFVTTRPHDLSFLEQDGVRDERVAENDIESLFFSVFRGDKEFGEETLHENGSEWATIEKSFLLRTSP